MTIHLISTSDMTCGRRDKLQRLLESVRQNAVVSPEKIKLAILLQNCTSADREFVASIAPPDCSIHTAPHAYGLSAARNILLRTILESNELENDDIVGFPDDDCWFTPSFFLYGSRLFSQNRDVEVFFCRCSMQPEDASFAFCEALQANVHQIVRLSSSNNVFYRGSTVKTVGLFDPELGLGTPIGGSEDTDYALRAYLHAKLASFIDRKLIGHPEPGRVYAAKYFQGSLLVLARYAGRRPGLAFEFARKICVGIYFVIHGMIDLKLFLASMALLLNRRKATTT